MSHYYTQAELEAMRKAQIKAELNGLLRDMAKQIRENGSSGHDITSQSANIVRTVFLRDTYAEGEQKEFLVNVENVLAAAEEGLQGKREGLDFSNLITEKEGQPTKLELEVKALVDSIRERPVLTEEDEQDYYRITDALRKILEENLDIEDKLKMIRMRVEGYLSGGTKMTDSMRKEMEERYSEYCALCMLLEMQPTETLPHRVNAEVKRMTAILEKRRQDEYVMDVIDSILDELGCHVKEDAVLDQVVGNMYVVDGHPLCDVFIGRDSDGILFEPVGDAAAAAGQSRQLENSANHVCSLYQTLEEKAAEQGVYLRRVYCDPVRAQEMYLQGDVTQRRQKKQDRKAGARKLKTMKMED